METPTSKVDWDFAKTVASIVTKKSLPEHYDKADITSDFESMTPQAEELVVNETGLSPTTPAKSRLIGRDEWVDANLASFGRLMRPLFEKLDRDDLDREAERLVKESQQQATPFSETELGKMIGPLAQKADPVISNLATTAAEIGNDIARSVGPKIAGAEVGGLLGFMAGRVLGQYDLLISEDEDPQDQDIVYYVGPNIFNLERGYGFPPKEFRLWIAIHECTHRAQFMGVPWLRPYFLSLVDDLINSVDPDPKQLMDALRRAKDTDADSDPLTGGLAMKLASPEQRKVIGRVTGLMSLLEGHGDITMDRAGKDLIPSQQRFSRVMSQRRKNATGISKFIQKATGMEAKLAQYEAGEDFIKAVEAHGGDQLFSQVWTSPEALPTLEEIQDPSIWIKRVG